MPNLAVWGHFGVVQRVEGGRRRTGSGHMMENRGLEERCDAIKLQKIRENGIDLPLSFGNKEGLRAWVEWDYLRP